MMFDRKQGGFNLVELMVTVTILGVLSAIAIPLYSKYVAKGRRATAITSLLEMAGALERNYNISFKYAMRKGKPDPIYKVGTTVQNTKRDDVNYFQLEQIPKFFNLNIDSISDTGFVLTATAVDRQAEEDPLCYMFAIDQNGTKRAWKKEHAPATGAVAAKMKDKTNNQDACW